MKKIVFWMLVAAGLAAAIVVIRRRRTDLETEEWGALDAGSGARADLGATASDVAASSDAAA